MIHGVMAWDKAGTCGECGATGVETAQAVAVAIGNHARITPCARCLEEIRTGVRRPETKRLLALGEGWRMLQLLKPGQEPDNPRIAIDPEAAGLIAELSRMVSTDPHRGTEEETAFILETKPRTREIGMRLYEIGGHNLMMAAYHAIGAAHGPSARSLEMAWDGCGEWFD